MLSNYDCDDGGTRRRFLNLATGGCAHVDLPELSGHRVEANTEGLRDTATDAIRLLNPLTRCLVELPPVTLQLRSVSPQWNESTGKPCPSRIGYAGISDETSPPSVALFLKAFLCNIAYAKPGDDRWKLVDGHVLFMSVMTLRGRVHFATYQGHVLKLMLHPRPRLVLEVTDERSAGVVHHDVVSYLVAADDIGRDMLMVRYYDMLLHLTPNEQRRIKYGKKKKKTSVIKVPRDDRIGWYNWHLLEVFKVDLRGKKLAPADESIDHRAVFVGDVASVSLSARRFPSVYGDAVYLGVSSLCSVPYCGLRRLKDKSVEPRLELVLEGGAQVPLGFSPTLRDKERIVPSARPCSLEEYLVCYVGTKNGIKD